MSEIDIDFHIECKNTATRDAFYELVSSYDYDVASQSDYRDQLAILQSADIKGESVFNKDTPACEFSDCESIGVTALRFHLFGGVHGGTRFYENLMRVLLQTDPIKVYTLAYNNQVGEIEVFAQNNTEKTRYCTGSDGEYDDLLFDILEQENPFDLLMQMHADGKLAMPAHQPEKINGIDVSILEDEQLYDVQIIRYLKKGVIFGAAVFLAGWLLMDYFWSSLVGGLITAVVTTFAGAFKLQNAKDKYDLEVNQMIKEEANEMGISEDQAIALMQYLERSLAGAEESAK